MSEPSGNNTSPPSHENSGLRLPPIRFERDGLDLRRPIMSRPQSSVIDLTDLPDSPPPPQNHVPRSSRANRPPRFSRDIIVLDAENDQTEGAVVVRDGSPEVEVLSSRTTQDPRLPVRARARTATLRPYLARPDRSRRIEDPPHLIQYMRNMFHNRHHRTSAQVGRPGTMAVVEVNEMGEPFNPSPGSLNSLFFDDPDDEGMFVHQTTGFQLPRDLDFDVAAFPMGGHIPQPPAPTYDAPPPPRDGFTRSPTEDQEIICPNCGDELGLGEDDIKRQVWVIKMCGHVCFHHVLC